MIVRGEKRPPCLYCRPNFLNGPGGVVLKSKVKLPYLHD